MTQNKLKVGAIGLGPVGSILGAYLTKAGAEIFAADLPFRIAQLKENGLRVNWQEEELHYDVKTFDNIKALADVKPDYIFIATKACILHKILPDVGVAAGDDCLVISAQNGIGTEDLIAQYVPAKNVCRMVVNYAGGNDKDGTAKMVWFNPPNHFGLVEEQDDSRLPRFVEILNSTGLTSIVVDPVEIKKKAFLKAILNAALLPLCAVLRLTMKEAMEGHATRQLAAEILREGFSVAAHLGYHYGEDVFDRCMVYLDKGGDHHPSMSIDLQNKLPTEIDFINGRIIELGRMFKGLDLSVNRILVSLLMTREVKNGTRKPDDFPDYLFE